MKIRVRISLAAYMLLLLVLAGPHSTLGLLSALLIHEVGHALAAKFLSEPIERVEVAPFGGVMYYRAGQTASKGFKGVLLALAGPAANYIALLYMGTAGGALGVEWRRGIISANLSMMMLNLLPSLPFDGGTAAFSLGYYLFPVAAMIEVLRLAGTVVGGVFCALAVMGFFQYGQLNITLLVVGFYVFAYGKRYRDELYAQNTYALICERRENTQAISKAICYWTSRKTPLCSLIPCLRQGCTSVFLVEDVDGELILVSEKQICSTILNTPQATLGNILEK